MGPLTTPLIINLRDYQEQAVEDIRQAFREFRRVLFVLSTGGGKTVIFAYITRSAAQKNRRIIIAAHRTEICKQISEKLDQFGVQHGRIMSRNTLTDDRVQVAMIQTLAIRIRQGRIEAPDVLIIGEAHQSGTASYATGTNAWATTLMLGVTATPERMDGRGLRNAFDEMVLGPAMAELIRAGHLAEYQYFAPPAPLDLSSVNVRGGDYAIDELEEAMTASSIVGDAEKHYRQHLNGRPAIAFCVTRAHARQVAEQFRAAGWKAAHIDGSMSEAVRGDLIASLADGRLNVLTSCELISEGVDVPACSGAILLRPTMSLALWLQQVGRTLRPKDDGSSAVILDHVGNIHRFGMPCMERDWSLDGKKKRKKAEDVTTCELCFKTFPAGSARSLTENCPGLDDTPCPFRDERKSTKELPAIVDGQLTIVTDIRPSDPMRPEWAMGLSLDRETTKGSRWFRLLELADTDENKLKQIAKARGYKRGWVQHALRNRSETKAGIDAILYGDRDHNIDPATWMGAGDAVLWGIVRAVDAAESSPDGYPSYWPDLAVYARDEIQRRRQGAAASSRSLPGMSSTTSRGEGISP